MEFQNEIMELLQLIRYVDGTPTSQVTLVTIRYYPPTHHDHTKQYHGHEWMTHILFVPCQSDVPFHEIRLLQTLTLKLQSQGHGCDQRAKSYSQPSILLTRFLFISHQSDQQFLRYSCFEIWPWNIQGQGHEWGKKVKVTYCTQYPTDALPFNFTSIGQPFLRYDQNSFWPWRNTSEIFKHDLPK